MRSEAIVGGNSSLSCANKVAYLGANVATEPRGDNKSLKYCEITQKLISPLALVGGKKEQARKLTQDQVIWHIHSVKVFSPYCSSCFRFHH